MLHVNIKITQNYSELFVNNCFQLKLPTGENAVTKMTKAAF